MTAFQLPSFQASSKSRIHLVCSRLKFSCSFPNVYNSHCPFQPHSIFQSQFGITFGSVERVGQGVSDNVMVAPIHVVYAIYNFVLDSSPHTGEGDFCL